MKEMFNQLWQSVNITKNTTQKLFSLLFALVFWIFVMDTDNPETTKVIGKVPLQLLGIEQLASKELQLFNKGPFLVEVKVRGRRKEVMALKISDFKVSVDLYQAKSGTASYPVTAEVFKTGIVIEGVNNPEIKLTIDQMIQANKPIQVDLVGNVPEPFFVDEPKVSKALIGVKGPERLVNQITNLKGQIDVTGVTAPFTTEIGLLPVDAQGKLVEGVTLDMPKVQVAIAILVERQIPIELVTEGAIGEGMMVKKLELIPNAIRVIGEPKAIELIASIKTMPVDLSLLEGTNSQPVAVVLPEGMRLKPGESVSISSSIEAIQKRIMTVDIASVEVMNLLPNFNVQFEENALDLMISGPSGLLTALEAQNVGIAIDVLGLMPGKHQLNFVVTLPEGLEWVKSEESPSRIGLTIEESTSGNQ